MTTEQQLKAFDEFTNKMRETISKKGDDYAGSERLANFKFAGGIANQGHPTPGSINVLNLIGTKVARLGQLMNSGQASKNESIQDSILDGANYFFLLSCVLGEEGK